MTVAHILRNKEEALALRVPYDERNFLLLCGTLDERNSCHDLFDTDRLAFIWEKGSEWVVLCGAVPHLHGEKVNIESKPMRRALHARAMRCIILKQVPTPEETIASRVRESTPQCAGCGATKKLAPVGDLLYCEKCAPEAVADNAVRCGPPQASPYADDDENALFEELGDAHQSDCDED